MTKIVATSDLHGHLPDIKSCDVCIIAGDVCPDYRVNHIEAQRAWLEGPFSAWLDEIPADLILGIGGNHDFALERSKLGIGHSLPWTWLKDAGYRYQGLWFWGTPWVPNLSRWAFHLTDEMIDEKLLKIPADTDVVISHGPPMGHCDYTVPKFGSVNAGFPGANAMMERVQPDLLICGHIHEGYGWSQHESGGFVLNVAHQTEEYQPINAPVVLTKEPNEARWGIDAEFPHTRSRPTQADIAYEDYLRRRYGF